MNLLMVDYVGDVKDLVFTINNLTVDGQGPSIKQVHAKGVYSKKSAKHFREIYSIAKHAGWIERYAGGKDESSWFELTDAGYDLYRKAGMVKTKRIQNAVCHFFTLKQKKLIRELAESKKNLRRLHIHMEG